MTRLLEQAWARVALLSEAEQDAIATLILEELEDEARWEATLARSHDTLDQLEAMAREDIKAGRFREGGFDDL